jgi:hypothetical protein
MENLVVCYAEGQQNGKWEAVCLDYDIAVQGDSLQGVIDDLRSAIHDYLKFVETLPERQRARMLRRGVPWLARAKFIYWAIMALFFHRDPNRLQRHDFTLPCVA